MYLRWHVGYRKKRYNTLMVCLIEDDIIVIALLFSPDMSFTAL